MSRRSWPSLLAALLLAIHATGAAAAELRTMAGEPDSLAAHIGQGKWTVVKIWASWCEICNAEAHRYVAFHEKHKDRDAVVLGISLDGWSARDAAQGFIDRHGLPYHNMLVEPQAGSAMFQELTGRPLAGTPAFLIYGPGGELMAQEIGAVPVPLIEQFIARSSASP